jgi:hypothetical protein
MLQSIAHIPKPALLTSVSTPFQTLLLAIPSALSVYLERHQEGYGSGAFLVSSASDLSAEPNESM